MTDYIINLSQSLFNNHILFGTVVTVGLDLLYFINDIHTFQHFTEYGICTVQMRSTAHSSIGLYLLGSKFELRFLGNLSLGLRNQ